MFLDNVPPSRSNAQEYPKYKCVLTQKPRNDSRHFKTRFSPFILDADPPYSSRPTAEGSVKTLQRVNRSRSVCIRPLTSPSSDIPSTRNWRDKDPLILPHYHSPIRKKLLRSIISGETTVSDTANHAFKLARSNSALSSNLPDLGTTTSQTLSLRQTLQNNAVATSLGSVSVAAAKKREDKHKWKSLSRLKTALFPSGHRAPAANGSTSVLRTPLPGKPAMKASPSRGCPTNLSFQSTHRTSSNLSWWSRKDKSNKPPWFPAGMGGTKSHHKQFRTLTNRLKISNILHKVATQRLVDSSRVNKGSPHRGLMRVGLESLPTAVCTRIRPTDFHPTKCNTSSEKRNSSSRSMGKLHCSKINEHQESSNAAQASKTSQMISTTTVSVNRYPQRGITQHTTMPSIEKRTKTPAGHALSTFKATKKKVVAHQISHVLTGSKDSAKLRCASTVNNISRGKFRPTTSEGAGLKSTSTTEVFKEIPDSTCSSIPIPTEISNQLKLSSEFVARGSIRKNLGATETYSMGLCTDTYRAPSSLDFNENVTCIHRASHVEGPMKFELNTSAERCTVFAPNQEPFGDWNASITSTSHACSAGPVTYASLWDQTADADAASDVVSSTCMGSSLGTAPGLLGGPKEADGEPYRKCSQGRASVSEETLILITDALDVSDNAYSSLASRLNSLVYAEELSLNASCKTGNELEACEHSKASTWSPMVEKETSHIDSPQLVTTFRDKSPFFLLSEGECELSCRFPLTDADIVRHCTSELAHGQARPSSTRPVQNYVDPIEIGRKSNEKLTNFRSSEDSHAVPCNRNQNRFLRKFKWPVRSLSAMKKNGSP